MQREVYVPPSGPPRVKPPDPAIYAAMGTDNIFAMLRDFESSSTPAASDKKGAAPPNDIALLTAEQRQQLSQVSLRWFVLVCSFSPPFFFFSFLFFPCFVNSASSCLSLLAAHRVSLKR